MSPTLIPRDRFLAHKHVPFSRWDIIVFDAPEAPGQKFVARLVGLPHEKLEIRNKQILINDHPIPIPKGLGPYVTNSYDASGVPSNNPISTRDGHRGNGCEGNPITLGPDEYFVLGDNSPYAADSRYWSIPVPGHQPGALPRNNILGKVTWLYWPPKRWRSLSPPATFTPTSAPTSRRG
jgi:signal peptidase I